MQLFFHAESEREKISVQNQLLAQKVCTKSLRFSSAVKSSAMEIIILHTHTHTHALSSFDAHREHTERIFAVRESCYFFFEGGNSRGKISFAMQKRAVWAKIFS